MDIQSTNLPPDLAPRRVLTPREAAAYLSLSPWTLEKWRGDDDPAGPPWVRLSERRIGYRLEDLDAWIGQRVHNGRTTRCQAIEHIFRAGRQVDLAAAARADSRCSSRQ
jgi:predicted DNA-binding transcriptional regulator AlpA